MATKIRVGQINFNTDVDVSNHKITNLANPTTGSDAANKYYVDMLVQGIKVKEVVKVATTGNITLSGLQTIDGVSLSSGDRVLVWQQTDQTENGIYVASGSSWNRAEDANVGSELENAACWAVAGDTYAGIGFYCQSKNIEIGTTNIVFVQFQSVGSLVAGDGISIVANTISVKPVTNGGIDVSSSGVSVKTKTGGGILIDSDGLYVDMDTVKGTLYPAPTKFYVGDGSTATFNLDYEPHQFSTGTHAVVVSLNGLVLEEGSGKDYTVNKTAKTITFQPSAPSVNDIIIINYFKA